MPKLRLIFLPEVSLSRHPLGQQRRPEVFTLFQVWLENMFQLNLQFPTPFQGRDHSDNVFLILTWFTVTWFNHISANIHWWSLYHIFASKCGSLIESSSSVWVLSRQLLQRLEASQKVEWKDRKGKSWRVETINLIVNQYIYIYDYIYNSLWSNMIDTYQTIMTIKLQIFMFCNIILT